MAHNEHDKHAVDPPAPTRSSPLDVELVGTNVEAVVRSCDESTQQACWNASRHEQDDIRFDVEKSVACACADSPASAITEASLYCTTVRDVGVGNFANSNLTFQLYPGAWFARQGSKVDRKLLSSESTLANSILFTAYATEMTDPFRRTLLDEQPTSSVESNSIVRSELCEAPAKFWLANPATGELLFHHRVVASLLPCLQLLYQALVVAQANATSVAEARAALEGAGRRQLTSSDVHINGSASWLTIAFPSVELPPDPPLRNTSTTMAVVAEYTSDGNCTLLASDVCGVGTYNNENAFKLGFEHNQTQVQVSITGAMDPEQASFEIGFPFMRVLREVGNSTADEFFPTSRVLADAVNTYGVPRPLILHECSFASTLTCDWSLTPTYIQSVPLTHRGCDTFNLLKTCETAYPPVRSLAQSEIDDTLGNLELQGKPLTLLWEVCPNTNLPTKNVTNGFVRLTRAFSLGLIFSRGWDDDFGRDSAITPTLEKCADPDSIGCQMQTGDGNFSCPLASGQLLRQFMSCAFNGRDISTALKIRYFPAHEGLDKCVAEEVPRLRARHGKANFTREDMSDVSAIVQASPGSREVHAVCYDGGHSIAFVDASTMLPVFTMPSGSCAGARQFTCSSCLPYLEPYDSALPYYLLIISSVKDIALMVVGLIVLERDGVRRRIAQVLARLIVLALPYDRVFMLYEPEDVETDEDEPGADDPSSSRQAEEMTGVPRSGGEGQPVASSEMGDVGGPLRQHSPVAAESVSVSSSDDDAADDGSPVVVSIGEHKKPRKRSKTAAVGDASDDDEREDAHLLARRSTTGVAPSPARNIQFDRSVSGSGTDRAATGEGLYEPPRPGEKEDAADKEKDGKRHHHHHHRHRRRRRYLVEMERWLDLWQERFNPRYVRDDEVMFVFCELRGLQLSPDTAITPWVHDVTKSRFTPTPAGSRPSGGSPNTTGPLTDHLFVSARTSVAAANTAAGLAEPLGAGNSGRLRQQQQHAPPAAGGGGALGEADGPSVTMVTGEGAIAPPSSVLGDGPAGRMHRAPCVENDDSLPPSARQPAREAKVDDAADHSPSPLPRADTDTPRQGQPARFLFLRPSPRGPTGDNAAGAGAPVRTAADTSGHDARKPATEATNEPMVVVDNDKGDRSPSTEDKVAATTGTHGVSINEPPADAAAGAVRRPVPGMSPAPVASVSASPSAAFTSAANLHSGGADSESSFVEVFNVFNIDTADHALAYAFFKDVVLRSCRCLVRNYDDPRVKKAFRDLFDELELDRHEMDQLRRRRRKWTKSELRLWKRFDALADLSDCIMLEIDAVDRKFTPQIWMLSLELVYAFVMLVVCFFEDGGNLGGGFKSYEAKYFTFVNSCTSVGFLVNAALRVAYAGNGQPGFFVFASIALLLPVIITHIIPGFIIFCWLPLTVIPLTIAVMVGATKIKRRGLKWTGMRRDWIPRAEKTVFTTVNVASRLTATFAVTLMLQTLFNYMVLFYHRDEIGLDYHGIITYEFSSRRWDCLWEKWLADATKALQLWSTFV